MSRAVRRWWSTTAGEDRNERSEDPAGDRTEPDAFGSRFGRTPDALSKVVAARINAWAAANHAAVQIDYDKGDWMARDPKGQMFTEMPVRIGNLKTMQ
jgi:hypothetical protein